MIDYYVTYEVMQGIGLIIVKVTHVCVGTGDIGAQVTHEVRKVDPGAKIIAYEAEEDCDDMMISADYFC